MAGESLITGALGAAGVPGTISGTVWTHENSISSDGNTREILLPDLPEGALDPISRFVEVTGTTPSLQGIFKHAPYSPASPNVTNDPFDQVVAYHYLSGVYHYLEEGLRFNMKGILSSLHGGVTHAVLARVNFMADTNAYYSRSEHHLAFGTAQGRWHLGSDGDVVIHELAHLVLDHMNPGIGGWGNHEGGAIHEAFGDALAALYFKDGEMSEDFVPLEGRVPSKTDGLRIVDNDLSLSDVGDEVHDRGRVYAAFFWSLYETFIEQGRLSENEARDLSMRMLMNHASHYRTSRPKPNDFADAVVKGTVALDKEGKVPLALGAVVEMIEAEAKKRGLRSPTRPEPTPKKPLYPLSVSEAQRYYGDISGNTVAFSLVSHAPFIGGLFETYQETYQTQTHGVVDVIGHGMQARFDSQGQPEEILDADVRVMQPGEVDESTLIPFDEALRRVSDLVQSELKKEEPRLRYIETHFQQTPKMVFEWKHLSSHVLTMQLCRQSFTQALPQQPKFVVLDDDKELSYEIDLGSAVFYVNSVTGSVQFAKKIFF